MKSVSQGKLLTSLRYLSLSLLLIIAASCGNEGVVVRQGPVPDFVPDIGSKEALDPKDPSLETYPSDGLQVDRKLTEIYEGTLREELKWRYSREQKNLDRPPVFDCEGYTRYVYRMFLDRDPWKDYLASEILDHTANFPFSSRKLSPVFTYVEMEHARRGDLVVWREAEGFLSNHVAIYDGFVRLKRKGKGMIKVPMIVTTSSSTRGTGRHAIRRFPLRYMMSTTRTSYTGPHFVRVNL